MRKLPVNLPGACLSGNLSVHETTKITNDLIKVPILRHSFALIDYWIFAIDRAILRFYLFPRKDFARILFGS